MNKGREFWIHNFPKNDVTPWADNPVAYRKYTNVVDLPGGFWSEKNTIHVIEYRSYEAAVKALKAWQSFENRQIEKEGPYVGKEINALINETSRVLKELGEHE